ncbi:unnamed protein product (macronuclear) [Paramecium tetraurelia]|uniref:glutathione transferase n=1 Tax=Paramecium tetraurelia TaxID=5888 RepID=A0BVN6_PARTE|nr:uncharacterized protein GSPATT00032455001 [Paramecium tetraurelia]CAK62603.1 unnamed protein product [Paramecium tetraurelia]|eukprot:XP_001430001.1 hypothetical protein (macronuclear) [Paramecium tetraurelia strain d4-2]
MENKVILGYWPIRGLAQPLRFFLEYIELPYEDKRYNDPQEWFGKDDQTFNSPFTNLPYLKDGDHTVFESDAIYHYLAHKVNKPELLGKDAKQQTMVATIRGAIGDLKASFFTWAYGNKETAEAKKEDMLKEAGEFFRAFNTTLERSTWLTGDTITYIDFVLWEFVDEFLVLAPEVITSKPKLVEFHNRISEFPQIKKYLESPNYIKRPFNSPPFAVFF